MVEDGCHSLSLSPSLPFFFTNLESPLNHFPFLGPKPRVIGKKWPSHSMELTVVRRMSFETVRFTHTQKADFINRWRLLNCMAADQRYANRTECDSVQAPIVDIHIVLRHGTTHIVARQWHMCRAMASPFFGLNPNVAAARVHIFSTSTIYVINIWHFPSTRQLCRMNTHTSHTPQCVQRIRICSVIYKITILNKIDVKRLVGRDCLFAHMAVLLRGTSCPH